MECLISVISWSGYQWSFFSANHDLSLLNAELLHYFPDATIAWCVVIAVTLLLLINDGGKLESLQKDGGPGRFPQIAGCKARDGLVDADRRQIQDFGVFHQCWHQLKKLLRRKGKTYYGLLLQIFGMEKLTIVTWINLCPSNSVNFFSN